MRIRAFDPSDLPALTALTVETFGPFFEETFRPLVGELVFDLQHGTWREDYRDEVAGLHDPAGPRFVAVAEQDGDLAGYIGWSAGPDRRKGSVTMLAVASAHRRQHVGTALCEYAFAALRGLGAEMVVIGTGGDRFHAPARALYERLGCTPLPVTVFFREL
jgi:ribosomal protein S18 acetylase RimI-like enzyme